MQVCLRIGVELEPAAIDQSARTPEFAVTVETVVLKEVQDIVAVNLDDSQIHSLEIHCPERKAEFGCVGKNVAATRQTDCRLKLV